MASRFVRPETKRIEISNGDWLLVKKRLTAGEERAMFGRMYLAGVEPDGRRTVDVLQTGLATIAAYLLDWSFTDDGGKTVAIAGLSSDDLTEVLNALDPDDFREVKRAVEAHEKAMDTARAEEKKVHTGAPNGSATSPSPFAAGGMSSGSETSTQTITNSSLS